MRKKAVADFWSTIMKSMGIVRNYIITGSADKIKMKKDWFLLECHIIIAYWLLFTLKEETT